LAYGGNGVCRLDGKVCFVPLSCPGDEVTLRIVSHKKSYCTAEIVSLLSPSPLRVAPECPIFGLCGGCNWQHISYPAQLAQKFRIFTDILWRGARIKEDRIRDVVAAPEPYGYRSRVQIKIDALDGQVCSGFYRIGTHEVVDIGKGCPIALWPVNNFMGTFRKILAGFPGAHSISGITIDCGIDGITACIQGNGNDISGVGRFFRGCAGDLDGCAGLLLTGSSRAMPELLWGNAAVRYQMPYSSAEQAPCLLAYQSGGFAQINQLQNISLLSLIRRLGDFSHTDSLLELYCGNGNFSIPLAAEVASVVGIESNAGSVRSARQNQTANGCDTIEFICEDVVRGIRRLIRSGRTFNVVLLDPPRSGAGDVVMEIVRLQPDKIMYVSCDPATLARDCATLSEHGYFVVESVPLDMFPQTFHLESVTLLTKQ
jgi:23S rRNA (uracil1939-C5)-methyltransferase